MNYAYSAAVYYLGAPAFRPVQTLIINSCAFVAQKLQLPKPRFGVDPGAASLN